MICVRSLQHTQMILHCCCEVTSVMSDSVRPHRRQPTRLPRPWDSPGKNTGVGFHFLLQCMKLKSESEVTQSCPTLSDPMDYSLPGSSIHGIFKARVLEWVAIAFSGFCISSCQRKTIGILYREYCCYPQYKDHSRWRKSSLNIHWKGWCWSWSSITLATLSKEPAHWQRPWRQGRLKAGGEWSDRGRDGWMAPLTQWTWVWASFRRWWRTGKPGVL